MVGSINHMNRVQVYKGYRISYEVGCLLLSFHEVASLSFAIYTSECTYHLVISALTR
jgi:hypothetical protein